MLGPQLWVDAKGRPELRQELFEPVRNESFMKPRGGLWTSTFRPKTGSDWIEWCKAEQFWLPPYRSWLVVPRRDARVLVIDNEADAVEAVKVYGREDARQKLLGEMMFDFEKLAQDYDAMHLTKRGQIETRFGYDVNLWGWDCESTVWFRWVFAEVRWLGELDFDEEAM